MRRKLVLELLERRDVPSLAAPPAFLAGPSPADVVTADFNGDGLPDLAVANNSTPGFVNVLLNSGSGTFLPARNFPSGGSGASSLAAAEINGDGRLDLVVTNTNSGTVAVLRGSGTGVFRRPLAYAAGASPNALRVSDFNADGKTDVVVCNAAGVVSVLMGQGNGALQLFSSYDVGTEAYSVTAGTFDGDTNVDFAVVGRNGGVSRLGLFLGNGDGSFLQPAFYYDAGIPLDVTSGDFNGDQVLDLAVATLGTVDVRLGNGDGTFGDLTSYVTTSNSTAVETADLSGDGILDLVVAHRGDERGSGVHILLGSPGGAFSLHSNHTGLGNPVGLAVQDYTGDANPDIAIVSFAPSTGAVLLLAGLGGGDFPHGPPTVYGGDTPTAIVSTNLNGDADPDLLVANHAFPIFYGVSKNTLNVLLGQAGLGFTWAGYEAGNGAFGVTVSDFNADGILDAALPTSGSSGTVSVLQGTGSGVFQTAPQYYGGNQPFDVAAADFNGDSIFDLAVSNSSNNGGEASALVILLGNGDGSFQSTEYETEPGGQYIITDDFNNDGTADLAISLIGDRVSVLLGNGDGTFQTASVYSTGASSVGIASADLNGDGISDLALGHEHKNTVSILLGNGDGTFQPKVEYSSGAAPTLITIGDLNGDTRLDIAAVNSSSVGVVSILLGNGDGSFQAHATFPVGGSHPGIPDLGDLDGDGRLDLVVKVGASPRRLHVFRGNGDGSFQSYVPYSVPSDAFDAEITDWNGDGVLDVVLGGSPTVLSGKGDGTLHPAVTYFAPFSRNKVAVADLNGDGLVDLATPNVLVLLNTDGSFAAPSALDVGELGASAASSDLNGDGFSDLVVTSKFGTEIKVFLSAGNGFAPSVAYTAGASPEGVVVEDFNEDGVFDIATANEAANSVSILFGNGDGTFQPSFALAAGTSPYGLVVEDFDADGIADLAVTDLDGGAVSVLIGRGDGIFKPPQSYAVGSEPKSMATGDFNNDGIIDLAVANSSAGTISILLGNGNGSFQAARHFVTGETALSLAPADINQDGWLDVAVVSWGTIVLLLNDGVWPPLPIGDGSKPIAPPNVNNLMEESQPTMTDRRTANAPAVKVAGEAETAVSPGSKYASRHIVRLNHAETMDSAFELILTK